MDKTISMHLSKLSKSEIKKIELLGICLWLIYSFLFMQIGVFLVFLVYFILLTSNKPTSKKHFYAIYSFLGILAIYDLVLLLQVNYSVTAMFLVSLIVTSLWFNKKKGLISQLSVGIILLLVPILLR